MGRINLEADFKQRLRSRIDHYALRIDVLDSLSVAQRLKAIATDKVSDMQEALDTLESLHRKICVHRRLRSHYDADWKVVVDSAEADMESYALLALLLLDLIANGSGDGFGHDMHLLNGVLYAFDAAGSDIDQVDVRLVDQVVSAISVN